MKTFKLLSLLLAISISTYAQSKIKYTLVGNISGTNGNIIVINNAETKQLDSVRSVGDKFEFRGEIQNPTMLKLTISGRPGRTWVFIEEGVVTIEGAYNEAEKQFQNIKVSGSEEHTVYERMTGAERGSITPDEMKKMMEYQRVNDTVTIEKFKAAKRIEMDAGIQVITKIAAENPSRFAIAYWVGTAGFQKKDKFLKERLFTVYSQADEKVKKSYYGEQFLQNYNR